MKGWMAGVDGGGEEKARCGHAGWSVLKPVYSLHFIHFIRIVI